MRSAWCKLVKLHYVTTLGYLQEFTQTIALLCSKPNQTIQETLHETLGVSHALFSHPSLNCPSNLFLANQISGIHLGGRLSHWGPDRQACGFLLSGSTDVPKGIEGLSMGSDHRQHHHPYLLRTHCQTERYMILNLRWWWWWCHWPFNIMLLVSVGLLEPLLLPLDPVEILTNVGKHSTQVPVPLREICTSPPLQRGSCSYDCCFLPQY